MSVDKSLSSGGEFYGDAGKHIQLPACFVGNQELAFFALFLGSCPSKRVGGDVAEWSKALPC